MRDILLRIKKEIEEFDADLTITKEEHLDALSGLIAELKTYDVIIACDIYNFRKELDGSLKRRNRYIRRLKDYLDEVLDEGC